MNIKELEVILKRNKVPINRWGKNGAKSVQDLLEEYSSEDCFLDETEIGFTRCIRIAAIDVLFQLGYTTLVLKEERQVFANGKTKVRNLDTSLGEKAKRSESLSETVQRALAEELQIHMELAFQRARTTIESHASASYPGLKTRIWKHYFTVLLPLSAYKPAGYVEHQDKKATYFIWTNLDERNRLMRQRSA